MHQRPAGSIRWERYGTPRGGDRWLARLQPSDERTYRRLVLPLVPRIERSSGPGAFAARHAPDGRLRPVRGARSAWRRAVRGSILEPTAQVVIMSDVRDCYPSMGERALEALGCSGALASFLRALEEAGVRGLPVGPDPSAILANGVLAHADRAAAAAGCRPIRWVDDVVLVAAGRRPAIRAFDAWRRGLAELGLEAHDGKSRMFTDVREALTTVGGSRASGA
ncbi:MAG: hypothetical protein E6G58_07515 [Actinobacteria bacterium]|nr:MAG: hypothetical protein E6G58_07515 [Actinomycetota bacterium]